LSPPKTLRTFFFVANNSDAGRHPQFYEKKKKGLKGWLQIRSVTVPPRPAIGYFSPLFGVHFFMQGYVSADFLVNFEKEKEVAYCALFSGGF
jgi:hypothetical protein